MKIVSIIVIVVLESHIRELINDIILTEITVAIFYGNQLLNVCDIQLKQIFKHK